MNKKIIMDKRAKILKGDQNKKIVNKGNHSMHEERHCCLCGRKLSSYISLDNNYVSIYKHYSIKVFDFRLYLCYNASSCVNHLI